MKIKAISAFSINQKKLESFYLKSFPKRSVKLSSIWKWFYRLGYNDYEPIVIEVDSRIIGMAGLIPSKLRCNEKILESIWFTDFIILKEFETSFVFKL